MKLSKTQKIVLGVGLAALAGIAINQFVKSRKNKGQQTPPQVTQPGSANDKFAPKKVVNDPVKTPIDFVPKLRPTDLIKPDPVLVKQQITPTTPTKSTTATKIPAKSTSGTVVSSGPNTGSQTVTNKTTTNKTVVDSSPFTSKPGQVLTIKPVISMKGLGNLSAAEMLLN